MKLTVCEFPDEFDRKSAAWIRLVAHVANTMPDIVLLPEMPFCSWIFSAERVDPALWREALAQHDVMMGRLSELACGWILASRPVEENSRRYNEAFLWSDRSGYRPVRRKWYLPDAPIARETTWFSQGDRNFSPVKADTLDVGFQLCSEMMFPEHAREIGFSDAHLIAQPRAGGSGRHWRVASEMSAIASGCYVASANRRSVERDWFSGGSWVLSPHARVLAETTAEEPVVTVEIDLTTAEQAKTHYPRDLQCLYRESARISDLQS
jgi:N-carbamoylputrescine amidase